MNTMKYAVETFLMYVIPIGYYYFSVNDIVKNIVSSETLIIITLVLFYGLAIKIFIYSPRKYFFYVLPILVITTGIVVLFGFVAYGHHGQGQSSGFKR